MTPLPAPSSVGTGVSRRCVIKRAQRSFSELLCRLSYGFWAENLAGIPPKILSSGRNYFLLRATVDTLLWPVRWIDRSPTISNPRFRSKIFSGIPVGFWKIRVCTEGLRALDKSS